MILMPIFLPMIVGLGLLISSFKEHLKKNNDYENKNDKQLKPLHGLMLLTILISAISAVYVASQDGLLLINIL